jgi:hypothetical protein
VTAAVLSFRTGSSGSPDATWTIWTPPEASPENPELECVIGGSTTECASTIRNVRSDRFLQYRVALRSDDAHTSVELLDIEIGFGIVCPSGFAVSELIRPVDLSEWQTVRFTGTVPTSTSLSVDIVSYTGTVLLPGASSGTELGTIDPLEHPSLYLRATLATEDIALTPGLDAWGVMWSTRQRAYLPLVRRSEPVAP